MTKFRIIVSPAAIYLSKDNEIIRLDNFSEIIELQAAIADWLEKE